MHCMSHNGQWIVCSYSKNAWQLWAGTAHSREKILFVLLCVILFFKNQSIKVDAGLLGLVRWGWGNKATSVHEVLGFTGELPCLEVILRDSNPCLQKFCRKLRTAMSTSTTFRLNPAPLIYQHLGNNLSVIEGRDGCYI